jgi:aspartyl-tRNA(Asn)/glutamyl-tRNA(Gln) amidotransferase subunit A
MDSTSVDINMPQYSDYISREIKGICIGIPEEYFSEGLDGEVRDAVIEASKILEKQGAYLKDISLPHTEYAVAAYYIVATAEASSNLARYDGIRYGFRAHGAKDLADLYEKSRQTGFGEEVKRRIMLGTYGLSAGYYDAYYLKALKVRRLIKEDFDKAFEKVDAVLTPTSPSVAFKIGEKIQDPLRMYLSDIYTISANLSGIPAISFPCGFSKENLPIGLQLMASPFNEEVLFQISSNFQKITDYHLMTPEL